MIALGRFCVTLALLGLMAGCGEPSPGAVEDISTVAQRLERQFAADEAELAGAKKTVHFIPDSGFNKVAKSTLLARADQLATSIHGYERDLWTEQVSRDLEWTKARICSLFGWVEKIQRLKLPYVLAPEPQFKLAAQQDFIPRTSPPSRNYNNAVSNLYSALHTLSSEDSEFAITAVVKVCELTETQG